MKRMSKIGDAQFRVMCEMWGVDQAIKAAKRIGVEPSSEQIDSARAVEKERQERLNSVFKGIGRKEDA